MITKKYGNMEARVYLSQRLSKYGNKSEGDVKKIELDGDEHFSPRKPTTLFGVLLKAKPTYLSPWERVGDSRCEVSAGSAIYIELLACLVARSAQHSPA